MVKFIMIEEVGIVTDTDGLTAHVTVPKKSSCEGCSAGTCVTGDQTMEIVALNRAGAKTGQKVRVVIHAYAYMKGSMVVYGIPAIGLVAGAVIGKEIMPLFFSGTDPDILSAVSGFSLLGLSFVAVKIWANRRTCRPETSPVIEEILS